MGKHIVKLAASRLVAEGTAAFYFEKPAGFEFSAGQSVDVTLLDPPETDAEGDTRVFSLAGAPHEPHLVVATRLRDTAFKRVLRSMPAGAEVIVEGPFGSMTLHRDTGRPAVILAGGIGITPFRSMICRAVAEKTAHRLLLLYSNRRPEDAAFLDELQGLARLHPGFRLVATMTDAGQSKSGWNGVSGRIDEGLIARFTADLAHPVYYTAGPPGLVESVKDALAGVGVDGADINSEGFAGY